MTGTNITETTPLYPPGVHIAQDNDEWPGELFEFLSEDMRSFPHKHGFVYTGRGIMMFPDEEQAQELVWQYCEDSKNRYWDPEVENIVELVWGKDTLHLMECDEEEFSSEMDAFVKECDAKEAFLMFQARSPPTSGWYLVPGTFESVDVSDLDTKPEDICETPGRFETYNWEEYVSLLSLFIGEIWMGRTRKPIHHDKTPSTELDDNNCAVLWVNVTRVGNKFITAECSMGSVYIDLKYAQYINLEKVLGENWPIAIIARVSDVTKAMRWECVKVL